VSEATSVGNSSLLSSSSSRNGKRRGRDKNSLILKNGKEGRDGATKDEDEGRIKKIVGTRKSKRERDEINVNPNTEGHPIFGRDIWGCKT
jgi:hypothetical protein